MDGEIRKKGEWRKNEDPSSRGLARRRKWWYGWGHSPTQRIPPILMQLLDKPEIGVRNEPLAFDILNRLARRPPKLCHQKRSDDTHAPAYALHTMYQYPRFRIAAKRITYPRGRSGEVSRELRKRQVLHADLESGGLHWKQGGWRMEDGVWEG